VSNQIFAVKPDEKTIYAEIKSVSQNSLLLNLPNGALAVLEIPQGTDAFLQGNKIEIPLSLIKDYLPSPSAVPQENSDADAVDKFASQMKQTTINYTEEYQKYAEAVLKSFETPSLPAEDADFAKALLKEIERMFQRSPVSYLLMQNLPKNTDVTNFFMWTANQIKNENLSASDFFSIPQILINSRENYANEITSQNPENIHLIVQNIEKFKENIHSLITTTDNSAIKNMLNEILNKIPQIKAENFAFAKIDGKAQTTFLPITLQTRFNSEFSAILSKNFPQLPKELFIDTANIIRNGAQQRFMLSQNLTKDVKTVLQDVIKETENPNPQHKITPAILSNLLIYANDSKNRQLTLPVLKALFTRDKSIENISAQIKNFTESLESVSKNIAETRIKTSNENLNPQTKTVPLSINENSSPQIKTILSSFNDLLNVVNSTQNKQTALPVLKSLFWQKNSIETISADIKKILEDSIKESNIKPSNSHSKILPPVLSNLLNFANDEQNKQVILPILKSLLGQENSIENISINIKKFANDLENNPYFLLNELKLSTEKLNVIRNIFQNSEMIFQEKKPIEYIISKIGILQNKSEKLEENLKGVLKEIIQHIKIVSQKLQNIPNFETNEKSTEIFGKLKDLSNSVNDALRKIDGSNLLANKVISSGRTEQTIIVPIQIADAWIQIELHVNKEGKNKHSKSKKNEQQVELNIELEKGNSVSAKTNLTIEKQLQVSINFTNDKMLEWFKKNYEEFCESLRSIGTESISVIFNKEKTKEAKEQREILINRFDVKG
jgi:hypothetical protein